MDKDDLIYALSGLLIEYEQLVEHAKQMIDGIPDLSAYRRWRGHEEQVRSKAIEVKEQHRLYRKENN